MVWWLFHGLAVTTLNVVTWVKCHQMVWLLSHGFTSITLVNCYHMVWLLSWVDSHHMVWRLSHWFKYHHMVLLLSHGFTTSGCVDFIPWFDYHNIWMDCYLIVWWLSHGLTFIRWFDCCIIHLYCTILCVLCHIQCTLVLSFIHLLIKTSLWSLIFFSFKIISPELNVISLSFEKAQVMLLSSS